MATQPPQRVRQVLDRKQPRGAVVSPRADGLSSFVGPERTLLFKRHVSPRSAMAKWLFGRAVVYYCDICLPFHLNHSSPDVLTSLATFPISPFAPQGNINNCLRSKNMFYKRAYNKYSVFIPLQLRAIFPIHSETFNGSI